jgi:hypothetical protein
MLPFMPKHQCHVDIGMWDADERWDQKQHPSVLHRQFFTAISCDAFEAFMLVTCFSSSLALRRRFYVTTDSQGMSTRLWMDQ